MPNERIEKLKLEYTDQQVTVDPRRPELARFAGESGQVKTISFNGCALVQFEGADQTWHDIELDYLKVVDKPQDEPADEEPPAASAERPAPKTSEAPAGDDNGLSRLELARMEKKAAKPAEEGKP